MLKNIVIPPSGKEFKNNAAVCVGTGRIGLALQREYAEHLKAVQKSIGFRYIRGHGLFSDDMGIYRELAVDGEILPVYNFTYLDRVMDLYLENSIRPFLELGFMPDKLKSGDETVFYWKGNVSPPASYEKWSDLVTSSLSHLIERYGRDEAASWPVEVWNEPNIPFWAGSMEEYFKLYDYSAAAVKKADPSFKVGGPAICGIETEKWLSAFFEHCALNNTPLDFATRHCYTANMPEQRGQFTYQSLKEPQVMIEELKETREIMARYPKTADLPLHITEFNSSYSPLCPVHDTGFQAAYIARILSEAGEYADSYSYWTFSDVFEEMDVPMSQFHGGFGLMALNLIKKPVFYAFEFFSKAGKQLLYRDDNLIVTRDEERYAIIGYNWHDVSDGKASEERKYSILLPTLGERAMLVSKDVGGGGANPLNAWSCMGKPRTLDKTQVEILRAASEPLQSMRKVFESDGMYRIDLAIPCNRLIMLEITPVNDMTRTYAGFDPAWFYGME
ncbi:MAG: xylan 1,4-beta-xylosidase [Clostridiales bacterium]|jgi:xylan 1,4-beta-xylosidase|nr:xylan 1,4-beta-xylosidase [Clostridiales bacterium]